MDESPRPVRLRPGEELAYARAVRAHFHEDASDEELADWVPLVGAEGYRAWVIREGTRIVANAGVYTMTVSVPGGARVPAAGVTAVGVAQTHRRRGLLRATMAALLDEAVARGEHVALLFASESAIYPRFGFGIVAEGVVHRIPRGARFRDPAETGLVRAADPEQALREWPAILEAVRSQRGGGVSRTDEQWRLSFMTDPASQRGGATGRRLVHVPGRGYAAYRVRPEHRAQLLPTGEVEVQELVASDRRAEAALWQHVCDIDLTTTVSAWFRPPDDALPLLLTDPLLAATSVGPPLYARLLDVASAFAARAYAAAGEFVLAVVDPDRDQSGTYRLRTDGAVGEVDRVTRDPELTLPIDSAAAVWLGGVRATRLAAAGRLVEHAPGAAARLDRLLAVDHLPWTPFEF